MFTTVHPGYAIFLTALLVFVTAVDFFYLHKQDKRIANLERVTAKLTQWSTLSLPPVTCYGANQELINCLRAWQVPYDHHFNDDTYNHPVSIICPFTFLVPDFRKLLTQHSGSQKTMIIYLPKAESVTRARSEINTIEGLCTSHNTTIARDKKQLFQAVSEAREFRRYV